MVAALAHWFPALVIQMIDIDGSAELEQRYGRLIPVLADADTLISCYELDRAALERHLAASCS